MQVLSNQAIVSILNKEYPEIIEKIISQANSLLPDNVMEDTSKIVLIVESLMAIKGFNLDSFKNKQGSHTNSENRNLLVAVVFLFYNPKRLYNIIQRDAKDLNNIIAGILGVDCRRVRESAAIVTFNYRVYKEFKKEVHSIYEQINQEHKFFN